MSKWFGLTLALVIVAMSSAASAQVFNRYTRLIAEEQPAPAAAAPAAQPVPPPPQAAEPAPAPAPAPAAEPAPQPAAEAAAEPAPEPAPEPAIEEPAVVGGKGIVSNCYPYANGCGSCGGCGSVWGGYVPGYMGCGYGLRSRWCGYRSYCGTCEPTCYPTVKYDCDPCGDACAPCRRPGLFSRLHARRALCAPSYGCGVGCGYNTGCGYGCGYGFGYGLPYSSYGISSGCSSCGGGVIVKGQKSDSIQKDDSVQKDDQPVEAPKIKDKSARLQRSGSTYQSIATSLSH